MVSWTFFLILEICLRGEKILVCRMSYVIILRMCRVSSFFEWAGYGFCLIE